MGIKEVLKQELERISLSKEEETEIKQKASEILSLLKKEKLKAAIGGSLAKGTMIRKTEQDIDLFVVFKNEAETEKLEEILKKIGLKTQKIHGSRDYFQIKDRFSKGKIIFEIIPVVELKKEKTNKKSNPKQQEKHNVTDFSLSHVEYITKKIKKNKKLAGEIMLAKSFCHAQDCYGAESYIKGFSGYALEVLVSYFGSFEKFLRLIKYKRVIDPEKKWKNEAEIKKELNASKLESPVILIDPTYKYRNVTSCLSKETFEKFLKANEEFLRAPTLNFFEKKELNLDELKQTAKINEAKLLSLSLNTDKQEGDIAGTKMKKFVEFIVSELERKEQQILRKEFEYDGGKSAFAYLVVKEKIWLEIKGPPLKNKQACDSFKKSRKKVYPKGGYLWTRQKFSLKEFLQNIKKVEEGMSVKMVFSIN